MEVDVMSAEVLMTEMAAASTMVPTSRPDWVQHPAVYLSVVPLVLSQMSVEVYDGRLLMTVVWNLCWDAPVILMDSWSLRRCCCALILFNTALE